jgi:hypothetical protein
LYTVGLIVGGVGCAWAQWQHVVPEGASPEGEELVEGAYWAKIGEDGVLTEETTWHLEQELRDGWVRVSPGDAPPYFWNRDTAERLHDFREQTGDSWERVVPADGRVYYWQTETGHRQWDDPSAAQFTMLEEEAGGGWLRVIQEHDAEEQGDETDGAEPKRSSCYYHHPDTGHSIWAEGEGEDDAYVPAILDGDDDASTEDDDDVWDHEGAEDPNVLEAAEALEVEMARKRREFLKYCSGGDRASSGQRPTVLLSSPGPYAHVEGLSDEEADEDPRLWGTAALRTTLDQGLQGEAGLDFDTDNRLKRFERRESWLKAHAKLRGGGSVLLDTGSLEDTNPSYQALRTQFRRGRAGGGSILLGGTSAGGGAAGGSESAAAARRRKFLMGPAEPEPEPAATMTMTTVTEAAGAKLTTTTVHEAAKGGDGLSLAERMKATGVAPAIHEQGPHVNMADRMREAQLAQATAKRQRTFLNQGGGAPAGAADGGGVSKMVHRARALSVRESRVAMLEVQLELEETVDVLIDQNQIMLEEVTERDKKIELLEKLLADGSKSVSEKLKLLSEYNSAIADREEAEEKAELAQAAK